MHWYFTNNIWNNRKVYQIFNIFTIKDKLENQEIHQDDQHTKLRSFLKTQKTSETAIQDRVSIQRTVPSGRNSIQPNQMPPNRPSIERLGQNFRQSVMNKHRQLDSSFQMEQNNHEISEFPERAAIQLQCLVRKRRARKIYLPLKKRYNYRRSIINELVQTEQNYLNDLRIIQGVYKELKLKSKTDTMIIDSHTVQKLFLNIDSLVGLAEQMNEILKKSFQTFTPNSKFGDVMLNIAAFFKIYYEYISNYSNSSKLYESLKKDNSKFKTFIQQLEKKQFKGTPFESYLVKPIQRVPKYVLLLKDLLKNTEQVHCDYKNIENSLNSFNTVQNLFFQQLLLKVNEINNKNMDKVIINEKLFELQKLYGNNELKILEANREYKTEESLQIFVNRETRPVIVYILSDLLLVTEREQSQYFNWKSNYKLLCYLHLNENSICKDLEDTDLLQNQFQIVGKNIAHIFVTETLKDKLQLITLFDQVIDELVQKAQSKIKAYELSRVGQNVQDSKILQVKYTSEYFLTIFFLIVKVDILGTQEIQESSSKQFTQYAIQIEIKNIFQKIYIRFSEFVELEKMVQKMFPKLKLPYFYEKNLTSKSDTKVIETRKISISNFLQTLLTSDEIIKDGSQILKVLGLPNNFFTLPELLDQQKVERTGSLMSMQPMKLTSSLQYNQTLSKFNYFGNEGSKHFDVRGSQNLFNTRGPIKPMESIANRDQPFQKQNKQVEQEYQLQGSMSSSFVSKVGSQRSNSQTQTKKISATKLVRSSQPDVSLRSSVVSIADTLPQKYTLNNEMVQIKIQIFTFPKITELEINITPETRASVALEDIAIEIRLQTAFDFKLYIQEKMGQRPVEEDELLWTLLVEKQTASQSTTQKLKDLVKKVSSYIYSYNQKQVVLKKHLYLPYENEKKLNEDPKRVQLIASQILSEIQSGSYKLNIKEYTMFTALNLYLHGKSEINEDNIPFNLIQEFLPPYVYKTIEKEKWQYLLPGLIQTFEAQVKDIQALNDQDQMLDIMELIPGNEGQDERAQIDRESLKISKQLTISDIGESPQNNQMERIKIAQYVLLDLVSETQFYGLKMFVVAPTKDTLIDFQKLIEEQFKLKLKSKSKSQQQQVKPEFKGNSIILCVGYSSLQFYESYNVPDPLLRLDYLDIEKVKAEPQKLVLALNQTTTGLGSSFQIKKQPILKFDTGSSLVIQSLMQEYKEILTQNEVEEDNYIDF